MDDQCFEKLIGRIQQETNHTESKLEILFTSRGFFTALQASRILYQFSTGPDKLRAMQIMEPRLTRMSCSEARDVIGAVPIHNDRVKILESVKRYLTDCQTREGIDQILSAYPFENDKNRARCVLNTVRSDVWDKMASGGHQGYAALGGLFTQSRPLEQHLYGPVDKQLLIQQNKGTIEVPVTSRVNQLPSMYTGHPSYAYPQGRDYAEDRGYPGNQAYADC